MNRILKAQKQKLRMELELHRKEIYLALAESAQVRYERARDAMLAELVRDYGKERDIL